MRSLLLQNISTTENLYNLIFQPVSHPSGMFIIWEPKSVDVLPAKGQLPITPMAHVIKDGGTLESYSNVSSIHALLAEKGAQLQYDLGPVAFSCEDGRQNRYLVTFTVFLNRGGNMVTVTDLDRKRIGSRPSWFMPGPGH